MSTPTDTPTTPPQSFINGRGEPMPPPYATCPEPHFRIKAGVLQQLHSHKNGGRSWWINVPTVDDGELDAIFR
jgi:hypothetical protein